MDISPWRTGWKVEENLKRAKYWLLYFQGRFQIDTAVTDNGCTKYEILRWRIKDIKCTVYRYI